MTKPHARRKRRYFQLNTDGGIEAEQGQSEGEASIGVVLKDPEGTAMHRISLQIGWVKDHHIAEYQALITGLRLARGHGVDEIRIFVDSRLVATQLKGSSKVRAVHLKPLWDEAKELLGDFKGYRITWVPRKQNAEADLLASRALGR